MPVECYLYVSLFHLCLTFSFSSQYNLENMKEIFSLNVTSKKLPKLKY